VNRWLWVTVIVVAYMVVMWNVSGPGAAFGPVVAGLSVGLFMRYQESKRDSD
jgi:hypothetical protein